MIKWLAGVLDRIRTYPDRRVARVVECPECGHSTVDAHADCPCWDPGCLCVVLHETRYYS